MADEPKRERTVADVGQSSGAHKSAIDGGGPGEPAGKRRRRFLPDTEVIGPPECPLMHRWTLASRFGRKVILHHFLPNATDAVPHDHPASFVTIVLRGGYDDYVPCPRCKGWERVDDPELLALYEAQGGPNMDDEDALRRHQCWMPCPECMTSEVGPTGLVIGDRMRAGMVRRRAAEHTHITTVGPRGCWTLVVMGRKRRRWGFLHRGAWFFWRDHERRFGMSMRCPDVRSGVGVDG